MHELTHAWQMIHDISRRREFDSLKYDNVYDYRLEGGTLENKDFLCYIREQQAEMVKDLYRLKHGETAYGVFNRHGSKEDMLQDLEEKIGDPPLTNSRPSCE